MQLTQLRGPSVRGRRAGQARRGGMAESFVKTLKRDYVYVHDRPDAQTFLSQLSACFEDYNWSHPHKALRMTSPREFMRRLPTRGLSGLMGQLHIPKLFLDLRRVVKSRSTNVKRESNCHSSVASQRMQECRLLASLMEC